LHRSYRNTSIFPAVNKPKAVLVADDHLLLADVIESLTEEGDRACCANDGQAALNVVDRDPLVLMLSGMATPRLDGPALVGRLRQPGKPLPAVLVTAAHGGVDEPGVRFVPEPFDVDPSRPPRQTRPGGGTRRPRRSAP
jgi:CheY-like chemotaxis protein